MATPAENSTPSPSLTLAHWTLFALVSAGVFLVFAAAALQGAEGRLLMPLDDVYIHFQYARQLAEGQPYVYNPGQPPSSGATSFLYPYVLAFGHAIGFADLRLGWWAMLVGALAHLSAQAAVFRLSLVGGAPGWLALALAFGLTGTVAWHVMSGMETGLMMAFTLWTLVTVIEKRRRAFVMVATLLALTRPEGSLMAALASGVMLLRFLWDHRREKRAFLLREGVLLLMPVLALGLQPLVNALMTGTWVASGNQAKSILARWPQEGFDVVFAVLDNWRRMWVEFFTGRAGDNWLMPVLLGPLALLGVIVFARQRRGRWPALLMVAWLLTISAAIATLDTAFWHFKRYQMPLLALFFPLAAWALSSLTPAQSFDRPSPPCPPLPNGPAALGEGGKRCNHGDKKPLALGRGVWGEGLKGSILALRALYLGVIVPIFVLLLLAQFAHFHRVNVSYVYQQPYQMAQWLRQNTPEDALIAVHDVGLMRYAGGRTTLDMVGLTTPGAAAYWRNGPGAVAEFLLRERPDYIASYGEGHGFGLDYLAATPLYGEPLAIFSVNLQPHLNVALAGDTQGIYRFPAEVKRPHVNEALDRVNVADVRSEAEHAYQWAHDDAGMMRGFQTEVHALSYLDCERDCAPVIGAGRLFNGEERFTLAAEQADDLILLTDVQTRHRARLDIHSGETFIASRWIPEVPGHFLRLATLIPASAVDDGALNLRIVPHLPDGGVYRPIQHALIRQGWPEAAPPMVALARYQDGAFLLSEVVTSQTDEALSVEITWYSAGAARGDYRLFVHLYDDILEPPVAQTDVYPGGGALPPGNWLPGMRQDAIVVDLGELAPGTYALALGFYDPATGERLIPTSELATVWPDGRLLLEQVEISSDGR